MRNVLLAFLLAAGPAAAQDVTPKTPQPTELPPDPPSSVPAPGESQAPPQTQKDAQLPPQPPEKLQQPNQGQAPQVEAQTPPEGIPDGQWVYTDQYGWVWMPYAPAYTYVPPSGPPFVYLYGPTLGWRWMHAPWIFGWGPRPFWGPRGFERYEWHARPWFHEPHYRGGYVGPRGGGHRRR